MKQQTLSELLKATLPEADLIDLGLIKQQHQSLVNDVDAIKTNLSHYQEDASELGIEYAGSLTRDDSPSRRELAHALDQDHLKTVKEKANPFTRRSNFWYVHKEHNEQAKYTRYSLANSGERIIYDEELQQNQYLAKQVGMSDAWEE